MSNPSSSNSPVSASAGPEEILKLSCPVCSAGLNLRRKHIGIEGKCVQCKTPVTAREIDGKVALVATESAVVAEPAPPADSSAPVQVHQSPSVVDVPVSSPESENSGFGIPETTAPVEAPVHESPATSDFSDAFSPPAGPPPSPWGFPGRDEETSDADSPSPAMKEELPDSVEPPAPATMDAFASDSPFGQEPIEACQKPEKEGNVGVAPPTEDPETGEGSLPPFAPSDSGSMFDSTGFPDPNLQPASARIQSDIEETTPPNPGEKAPSAFDPPMDQGPEIPEQNESQSFSLEKDDPMTGSSSALFGGKSAAGDSDSGSGEINTSWGAKVPSPGHASISPFNDSEPSAGFAESLFREKAEEQSGVQEIAPKSPFGDSDSGAMAGGALFSNSASQVGASSAPATSPQEEVVLDGDGRPMKPMTDEEKDAFAKEMMQVGDYHKRSPWVVRIVKFLITMVVLGGLCYAGYIFMPDDKIKELQQKTLEFLEPGSVLLDFLPVEITENENGEKEMKVKAVESLNEFSTEMDAYLDASEDNLKESGALIPEREKAEKMEGPDIPKLPFDLPGMKGKLPSAEPGEAEKE